MCYIQIMEWDNVPASFTYPIINILRINELNMPTKVGATDKLNHASKYLYQFDFPVESNRENIVLRLTDSGYFTNTNIDIVINLT